MNRLKLKRFNKDFPLTSSQFKFIEKTNKIRKLFYLKLIKGFRLKENIFKFDSNFFNNLHVRFVKRNLSISNVQYYNISKSFFSLDIFLSVNAHLGYEVSRWNPILKNYIFGCRNGMHVLNLRSTIFLLRRLFGVIPTFVKFRKTILFVSENRQLDYLLKKVVLNFGHLFSSNRWIGGVVTNFKFIISFIYLLFRKELINVDLINKGKYNFVSKRTKKLQVIFDGIRNIKDIPLMAIILDGVKSKWALNELRGFNLICATFIDSTATHPDIEYAIPSNVHGFANQVLNLKLFQNVIENSFYLEKQHFLTSYLKSFLNLNMQLFIYKSLIKRKLRFFYRLHNKKIKIKDKYFQLNSENRENLNVLKNFTILHNNFKNFVKN